MPSTVKAALVRARRADLKLAAVALALAAALGVLGWWQYRSVREASEAERDRMQALLASRATQFERDLDREVTRAFVWLQVDASSSADGPRRSVTERLARWYDESPRPELLKAIYVIRTSDATPSSSAILRTTRFDQATGALVDASLPPELSHITERLAARDRDRDRDAPFGGRRGRLGPPVDPAGPALIVGQPWFRRNRTTDRAGDPGAAARHEGDDPDHDIAAMVALLDTTYLAQTLLPSLAAEHFPPDERFAFRLRVTRVSDQVPVFVVAARDGAHGFLASRRHGRPAAVAYRGLPAVHADAPGLCRGRERHPAGGRPATSGERPHPDHRPAAGRFVCAA